MGKNDAIYGILGVAVGLLGIGYAVGTHTKMANICQKLDCTIDELAGNTTIDIPDEVIQRAVEKAVTAEVKAAVSKATDVAILEVKRDIHKQVSDAVEAEYSDLKGSVLSELTEEAAKIDVKRVREDVERAAKKMALEKFDSNLDKILEDFSEQLKNTSRICTSIADTMAGYKTPGRETVLRIG